MAIQLPDIVQKVVLNHRETQRGLLVVERGFKSMGNEAVQQSAKASAAVEALQARVDELGDEAQQAERKIGGLGREVARLTRQIARMRATAAGTPGGRGGGGRGGGGTGGPLGGLADAFKSAGNSAAFFGGVIQTLKIPAIIWGIGQLIPLVGALAGGFVALAGALGPVAGAFAALPGLIGGLIQGFGGVLLAVSGVEDAFKAYSQAQEAAKDTSWADAAEDAAKGVADAQKLVADSQKEVNRLMREGTWEEIQAAQQGAASAAEALTAAQERQSDVARRAGKAQAEFDEQMKKLDPSVRRFIEAVERTRPQFEALRRTAQAGLFPGVTDAVIQLRDLFVPLTPIVALTTRVFGDFARNLADVVTSDAWTRDITFLGAENVGLMSRFGDALIDVLNGFRNLTVAAAPLLDYFVGLTERFGEWMDTWARTGRETGRFNEFFSRTSDIIDQLFRLMGNLWGGLRPVFREGAELGQWMLDTWEEATARFRTWANTAAGQRRINEYFDSIRPILREVGRLFADLAKGLGALSTENTQATASMVAQLRTELLPAVLEIFRAIQGAFGPAFISLVAEMAETFSLIAGETGPLTTLVSVLTRLFGALNTLLTEHPALKGFVLTLITMSSTMRAFQVANMISGLGRLAGAFGQLVGGRSALNTLIDKLGLIAPTAGKGTEGMLGFVGQLVARNPQLLLVAAAVTGITAALVNAWRESETFRDIFTGVWNTIRSAVEPVFNLIGGFLRDVATLFTDNADALGLLAAAFSLLLIPQLVTTIGYFTTLVGMQLASLFTSIRVAVAGLALQFALAQGALAKLAVAFRALSGVGAIAIVGALVSALGNATSQAKALRQEIEAEHDMESYEGVVGALEDTREKLLEVNEAQERNRRNPLGSILKGTLEVLTPMKNTVLDTASAVEELSEAEQKQYRIATQYQDAIGRVGRELGISAAEADRLRIKLGLPIESPFEELIGPITDLKNELNQAPNTARFRQALQDLGDVAKSSEDKVNAFKTALDQALGTFDQEEAVDALQETVDQASTAFDAVEGQAPRMRGLLGDSADARANRATARQIVDNFQAIGEAAFQQGMDKYQGDVAKATEYANQILEEQRPAAERALVSLGKTRQEAQQYLDRLNKIPGVVTTVARYIGLTPDQRAEIDKLVALSGTTQSFQFAVDMTIRPPGPNDIAAWTELVRNLTGGDVAKIIEFLSTPLARSLPGAVQSALAFNLLGARRGGILRAQEGLSRPPQTTDSAILWGEGRDTEAYIPYERRYRARAVGLLSQVAKDFGLAVMPRAHRSFAAGSLVPHMAIDSVDASIRRLQAGGIVRGGGASSISRTEQHNYGGIYVETVDRPTGERLGRDIAWALIGSRGPAVQKVIR